MEYSIVGYLGYKEGVGDLVFEDETQFVNTAKAAVEYYNRNALKYKDAWWGIEESILQACTDNGVKNYSSDRRKILFSSSLS